MTDSDLYSFANRAQRLLNEATAIFLKCDNWLDYFRQVLDFDGIIYEEFKLPSDRCQFWETRQGWIIQRQLAKLFAQYEHARAVAVDEPTRVITVRLPKSMHHWLKDDAHDSHVSLNQFCIAKLLRICPPVLLPTPLTAASPIEDMEAA